VQLKQPFWHDLPGGAAGRLDRIPARARADRRSARRRARRLPWLTLRSDDALTQLSQEEEGELRMSELAEEVVISRSGLTRLVERLERRGFVERRRGDRDPRRTFVRITPAGFEKLAEATPTHLGGVRRLFVDKLSTPEARVLAAVFVRLHGRRGRGG
jgi:DNA-binding MarR family transcriptional regulator